MIYFILFIELSNMFIQLLSLDDRKIKANISLFIII